MANGPATDVFAVTRVLDQPGDFHAAGLVHLVAGDDAGLDAPFAALVTLPLLSHPSDPFLVT